MCTNLVEKIGQKVVTIVTCLVLAMGGLLQSIRRENIVFPIDLLDSRFIRLEDQVSSMTAGIGGILNIIKKDDPEYSSVAVIDQLDKLALALPDYKDLSKQLYQVKCILEKHDKMLHTIITDVQSNTLDDSLGETMFKLQTTHKMVGQLSDMVMDTSRRWF